MATLSVVIPSYRRPAELKRCLDGIARGAVPPREILVCLRPTDVEARRVAAAAGATVVDVHRPGHLPPLIAALDEVAGEVMAIVDDDAVPRADWVGRIAARFSDPHVVAVGGPVDDRADAPGGAADRMRRLRALSRRGRTWYRAFEALPRASDYASGDCGRETRECDHLSGGNLAVRVAAMREVGFDMALNRGAAIAWEADVCLGLARLGRVLFDPLVVVDHFSAPRKGAPPRDAALQYASDYSHDLHYIAAKHLAGRELAVFLPAMALVGQRVSPGALRSLPGLLFGSRGDALAAARRVWTARREGFRSGWCARRRMPRARRPDSPDAGVG